MPILQITPPEVYSSSSLFLACHSRQVSWSHLLHSAIPPLHVDTPPPSMTPYANSPGYTSSTLPSTRCTWIHLLLACPVCKFSWPHPFTLLSTRCTWTYLLLECPLPCADSPDYTSSTQPSTRCTWIRFHLASHLRKFSWSYFLLLAAYLIHAIPLPSSMPHTQFKRLFRRDHKFNLGTRCISCYFRPTKNQ